MGAQDKKILIFSNCAASTTESNGRIHMTHFRNYENIFNFFLTGSPDCKNVNYLTVSYKSAFFSKIMLSLYKPRFLHKKYSLKQQSVKKRKNRKPFYHWARNFCFKNNKGILVTLERYIKDNGINFFALWGSNVSFLYEYVYKLSNKLKIPFITITSEDYPLKKYNYINNKRSMFFNLYQKQLYKYCIYCYKNSKYNVFSNNELKEHYENMIRCTNNRVIYFGSDLCASNTTNNSIKSILYGGKLYNDRIDSLLDVANALKACGNITINVYGLIDKKNLLKFREYKNVKFHGFVDYNSLIKKIYSSDALLHVEGFDEHYIKDCMFAFSTKISDYIMTRKPFIVYGPKIISGVNFYSKLQPQWCFTSKKQLDQLPSILAKRDFIQPELVEEFSSQSVSLKIKRLIEE